MTSVQLNGHSSRCKEWFLNLSAQPRDINQAAAGMDCQHFTQERVLVLDLSLVPRVRCLQQSLTSVRPSRSGTGPPREAHSSHQGKVQHLPNTHCQHWARMLQTGRNCGQIQHDHWCQEPQWQHSLVKPRKSVPFPGAGQHSPPPCPAWHMAVLPWAPSYGCVEEGDKGVSFTALLSADALPPAPGRRPYSSAPWSGWGIAPSAALGSSARRGSGWAAGAGTAGWSPCSCSPRTAAHGCGAAGFATPSRSGCGYLPVGNAAR